MPCHFRQFNGPPTSPARGLATFGPHRDGALPTSAPDSPPPSPRRSEVNRRRGLKTTPTLSQRPSLPRLLNIVSLRTLLHRPPNHPSLPPRVLTLSPGRLALSPSRLALTPVVLLTSHPLSRPVHLALLPRRRNTNADEFLLLLLAPLPLTSPTHPPAIPTARPPNAFSSPFFMRLLTISSNCAHPPPPRSRACLSLRFLALLAVPYRAVPFRETERMRLNKRDDA